MKKKIYLFALCSAIVFLLCGENTKAATSKPVYDSTCCEPDSLRFVSANYPVFCVSWKVFSDSICQSPQGFEVQWKLLSATVWKSAVVTYSSGTVFNFCDSVDTCGIYIWRVRTKCNDSTYSNWVNGSKITIHCTARINVQNLSILPNPAQNKITVNMKSIKPEQYKLSIVNMSGKTMLEKIVYIKSGEQLQEELFLTGWQKGIYFVTIASGKSVISRAGFVKE